MRVERVGVMLGVEIEVGGRDDGGVGVEGGEGRGGGE